MHPRPHCGLTAETKCKPALPNRGGSPEAAAWGTHAPQGTHTSYHGHGRAVSPDRASPADLQSDLALTQANLAFQMFSVGSWPETWR